MSKNKIIILMLVFLFIVSCAPINAFRFQHRAGIERWEVENFISKVRTSRNSLSHCYRFARFLQERRKYAAAIEEYEKVLAIAPDHVHSLNAMGICYDQLGDYSSAAACYKRALEINHRLDYVYNNLGYSYLLNEKWVSAINAFIRAIDLNDKDPRYHNNLGLAYYKIDQHALSWEQIQAGGGRADFYARLTLLEEKQHLTGDAVEIVKQPAKGIEQVLNGPSDSNIAREKGTEKRMTQGKTGSHFTASNKAEVLTRIEISNGNGVPGMAAEVADYLKRRNFSVTRLTNAAHFGFEKTRLFYSPGYMKEAYALAKQIPGWQNIDQVQELGSSGIKIRLLIGRDLVQHKDLFFAKEQNDEFRRGVTSLASYDQ